ncbi:Putative transposable element, partial [Caligus rogercresseyi]
HGSHQVPDRLQAHRGRLHRDPEDQLHPLGPGELPRWECGALAVWSTRPYGEGHAGVLGAGDELLDQGLSEACKLRHPNIAALKAAVNQEWAGMDEDFVVKICQAFRKCLMAIVVTNGG